MPVETKPIQYSLVTRKATLGNQAGKNVQVALPTGRQRVSFRALAREASRNLTFSEQEIMACVNELTAIAKLHVENGDIVEFGDLGTLSPSFRSKAIPVGEKFNALTDISEPKVTFRANRHYFQIERASYEKAPEKEDKDQSGGTANSESTQTPSGGSSQTPSGTVRPEDGPGSL